MTFTPTVHALSPAAPFPWPLQVTSLCCSVSPGPGSACGARRPSPLPAAGGPCRLPRGTGTGSAPVARASLHTEGWPQGPCPLSRDASPVWGHRCLCDCPQPSLLSGPRASPSCWLCPPRAQATQPSSQDPHGALSPLNLNITSRPGPPVVEGTAVSPGYPPGLGVHTLARRRGWGRGERARGLSLGGGVPGRWTSGATRPRAHLGVPPPPRAGQPLGASGHPLRSPVVITRWQVNEFKVTFLITFRRLSGALGGLRLLLHNHRGSTGSAVLSLGCGEGSPPPPAPVTSVLEKIRFQMPIRLVTY